MTPAKSVIVTGGTGFIGRTLVQALSTKGYSVSVLGRNPPLIPEGASALVNLAGESIAGGRWTPVRKLALRDSRIGTTRALVEACSRLSSPPAVLINASAVGYYGDQGDRECDESSPPGDDFLARLCVDWESQALKAKAYGLRVVCLRLGIVLGPGGGALAKMLPPFRLFAGGPLGDGRQWMSWISLKDAVALILHALECGLEGPLNAAAPQPVTNEDFSTALGKALGRPAWARLPAGVLRLLLGEMAEMLLKGQKVTPRRALESGFKFSHPYLPSALSDCLKPGAPI